MERRLDPGLLHANCTGEVEPQSLARATSPRQSRVRAMSGSIQSAACSALGRETATLKHTSVQLRGTIDIWSSHHIPEGLKPRSVQYQTAL